MLSFKKSQYGLKETGEVDSELMAAIKRPRCGHKDKTQNNNGLRFKYEVNEGRHKWRKNPITYAILGFSNDLPPEIQSDAFDRAFQGI